MNKRTVQTLLSWLPLVVLSGLLMVSCDRGSGKSTSGKRPSVSMQTQGETIKVGAVLPLTGDSAAWGEQGKYGVELALDEINATGGVAGKKLQVVYEDSKADPKTAVSAIQKLISVDKVSAVVGAITSAETLAMAPLAEKNHVVLMGISSSAPAISEAGDYIFRVWPSDNYEGEAIAEYVAQKGYKRVGILYIQTDYGTGLRDIFTSTFQAKGGKVVSSQGYNQNETDFKPLLLKVTAQKPDAIYMVGYYKDGALIIKQAKDLGIRVQFFGATAVENADLVKIAGKAAEGLIYPTINDFDPASPREKTFIENCRKRFGKEPDWAASHAHDALLVIAEAMKKGGTTGPEIQKALDTTRLFEGVTGKIRFDDKGDVIDKPVVIKTIKNGQFEVLQAASL